MVSKNGHKLWTPTNLEEHIAWIISNGRSQGLKTPAIAKEIVEMLQKGEQEEQE